MNKQHSFILIGFLTLVTLFGCKPSPDNDKDTAGKPTAVSADAKVNTADMDGLTCDCERLVPIDARPEYPRVAKMGAGCRYMAAGSMPSEKELKVLVKTFQESDSLSELKAEVLDDAIKVTDTDEKALPASGSVSISGVIESDGNYRIALLHISSDWLVVSTREYLGNASPTPGFPTYIDALQSNSAGACRTH